MTDRQKIDRQIDRMTDRQTNLEWIIHFRWLCLWPKWSISFDAQTSRWMRLL